MSRLANLLLALSLYAQKPPANPAALELHLAGENPSGGVPQDFVFQIVNHTDHDVRLPKPETLCQGSHDGEIHLQVTAPLDPVPASLRPKGGCTVDRGARPAIATAVKLWQTVHPGKSFTVKSAGHAMLLYDDLLAGKYTFSATYTPPVLSSDDQKELHDMGIDFPTKELTSNSLSFKKK